MSRRLIWTGAFLTITALAVGLELWAANDRDPDTTTWTELTTAWVPQTVTMGAIAALTAWLGPHFVDAYKKREEQTMAEPIPVPPTQEADARNRGWRTLVMGLAVDVSVALLLAVGPQLIGSDFAWTANYWKAIGLLAATTVVKAIVSYAARKLIPPQFDQQRTARPLPDTAR